MENTLIPYQAVRKIPGNCALVFAPHPDDEVFGCGGAIMRHVEQGIPVHVIVVSDGAYGASEETKAEYILQRQQESVAAAGILGYGTPVFWQYQDRQVCYGEKLIQEILTAIRETGADLVYVPSVFEMHPDHRALSMATIEAVRRIGDTVNIALYEVGIPLPPNRLLDISDLVARKAAAMACFVSQNTKQRYDQHIASLNHYRTYTLPADVIAAEAYILLSAEDLANDPLKLYQSEHTRQKLLGLPLDGSDLPLVSVIIRSMDRPTLSDALDSVALQTYQNIEVVVVDAKGEGHREIGQWCGRFPLRIFGTGQRLKRSLAANFGLDSASGEYLIFLDDDDLFDSDHISNLIETLNNSKNCSVAYAGVRVANEKGVISGTYNQTFAAARLMAGNFIPIHAVLFKRDLVAQGCRFDENLDSYEDWDFWLQAARKTDFSHTSKVSAVYRTQLGDSGMSLPLAHHLPLQRQCRLILWEKWWNKWTVDDFDCLVTDFREQLASLQQQLENSAHTENQLRCLLAEKERLQTEYEERIIALNQTMFEWEEQIAQLKSTQRQYRLMLWEKWWHKWTTEDFDCLVADFHQQLASLQQQLEGSAHTENQLRCLLAEKERLQTEYEERIIALNQTMFEREEQIAQLKSTIAEILNSRSWKLTAPVRFFILTTRKILKYGRIASDLAVRYYHRESVY
ncbi:MAG: PIG-L family deacetylase, partial [Nitrosomonas sp.]|nr:PIG-L family deacetylase [Nitrosomonas sp.]